MGSNPTPSARQVIDVGSLSRISGAGGSYVVARGKAVVLRALSDRADQVIRNPEDRKVTGMAAMDETAALVVGQAA